MRVKYPKPDLTSGINQNNTIMRNFFKKSEAAPTVTEYNVAKAKLIAEYRRGDLTRYALRKHLLFLDRAISIRTMVIGAVKSGEFSVSEAMKYERAIL
jgi:hypothetical protein